MRINVRIAAQGHNLPIICRKKKCLLWRAAISFRNSLHGILFLQSLSDELLSKNPGSWDFLLNALWIYLPFY